MSFSEIGSESFRVDLRAYDGSVIIALAGELDISSIAQFEQAFEAVQAAQAKRVVIDFTELQFVDSTGLSAIVGAMAESERAAISLVSCGIRGQVEQILDLTGIRPRLQEVDRPPSTVPWSPGS